MTRAGLLTCLLLLPARPALARPEHHIDESTAELILREAVAIDRVGKYGRSAIHIDPIQKSIVTGVWRPPAPGDAVTLADGLTRTWQSIPDIAGEWFKDAAHHSGYASVRVHSDAARIMMLEAAGHGMVYVNGEPRAGDPYRYGFVRPPVQLREGENELLFHAGRGPVSAKLAAPRAPHMIDIADSTLPDLIVDDERQYWASVVVINATNQPARGHSLAARRMDAADSTNTTITSRLPTIPPLTVRKVAFRISGPPPRERGEVRVELTLVDSASPLVQTLDSAEVKLRARRPEDSHRRTFVSEIDGSVQYYAVRPARREDLPKDAPAPGLVLTLHGASVEAMGQADCYAPKSWCHIVAPTNRRSFGFDWEDWGRLDAIEVLNLAQADLGADPARTWLTGHSMGGHGTWQLGAIYPDRFAAIGPSAGWISFSSYGGAANYDDSRPIEAILKRAAASSDTLLMKSNYTQHGIYVLHGDEDENVPVAQARTMVKHLAEFNRDFAYHEQPGARHWWGNACLDWEPMLDLFQSRTIPRDDAIDSVDFTTVNLSNSSTCHWIRIDQQIEPMRPSSVQFRLDRKASRLSGKTTNVAAMTFMTRAADIRSALSVELDDQKLPEAPATDSNAPIAFARIGEQWAQRLAAEPATRPMKVPGCSGPFKDAFRNRMMFVYGTRGTPAENAWAFTKARFDAETFWYRGNGSIDIVADTELDPADPDPWGRNLILYGNADTNAAWGQAMGACLVNVRRGGVTIGERSLKGEDVACLVVCPDAEGRGHRAAVSGTGVVGMRLTDRLPYFVSGVAYPDVIVIGPESLDQGTAGIRAAGFFSNAWTVVGGEIAWADGPPVGQ